MLGDSVQGAQDGILPGTAWKDEAGELIQAHGGGILKHGELWYWYGEDKRNGYFPSPGVSCYSSRDLINWKHEGVVCANWVQEGRSVVPNTPEAFINETQRAIIERPKVIYNDKTGMFVMWMHLEGRLPTGTGYQFSSAGVAVSESPVGPFRYVNCLRPVPGDLHQTFSKETAADQVERGSTFRDMTLFKDDDGSAYVIYAAESNYTMHIIKLSEDYCDVLPLKLGETWNRILVQEHREAPAMFKYAGSYYLMTSGATGWTPNSAWLHVSDLILGPYSSLGNPCRGPESENTFMSQSTFILPVNRDQGHFIYMGDRWIRGDIGNSTYVWLPFQIDHAGEFVLEWRDAWDLSFFE